MRLIGCLLLVSGWLLVLATLLLLATPGLRTAFIAAGLVVEAVGLAALAKSYILVEQGPGGESSTRRNQR